MSIQTERELGVTREKLRLLEERPDSPTHGVIRPARLIQLAQYEADLHATRLEWEIYEK